VSFFAAPATTPSGPVTATCPNVWTRTNGARLPVASMVSVGITSSQGFCRQKCLVYPTCVGISYSIANGACFLETRSAWINNTLVGDPVFIHYDLSPTFYSACTRGCSYSWTQVPGIINGSTSNNITTTLQSFVSCRIACVANANCVGVYWSPANASGNSSAICVLIIVPTNTNFTGSIFLGNGSTPTSTTTYALTRVTVVCGPCSVAVHTAIGFSDNSSVIQTGVTDRTSCRTACINNPLCTGYDFGGNGSCSLSFTPSPLLTSSSSLSHFDIVRSACGNGCQDKFDLYQSTTSVTSAPAPAYTNEQACRIGCQTQSGCYACDWNQAQGICTFSSVSNSRNLEGTSPGWNHYEWYLLPFCDNDSP
jgi:hypothetical protein